MLFEMPKIKLLKRKIREYLRRLSTYWYTKYVFIAFLLLIYFCYRIYTSKFLETNARFTSAVKCKADVARAAIPNNLKREAYLKPIGENYAEIEDHFFYFISKLTTNCQNQEHLGPPEEGGWDVCLERRYDIHPPCLIYSFGVGFDFGFEKDAEKFLKCEIHSFDPSMNMKSSKISNNIYFHDFGIDGMDTIDMRTRWHMKKFSTILSELGHKNHNIDLLKMDVEFSEWLVLYDLIESGHLKQIRQLVLEIHTPEVDIHDKPGHRCSETGPETLTFMLRSLVDLRNAGFSLFSSRTNYRTSFISSFTQKQRYCCHNLHFVNTEHQSNQF